MMNVTATLASEFERESQRIDQLIWEAISFVPGQSVLFCGVANDIEWIKRAAAIGVAVTVISDDPSTFQSLRAINVNPLRGSTSMLPVGDNAFDVAIAFHYLHEVDPLFHANIIAELARVAKRSIIVEPTPPSDPLGKRIASLYARVKRELGEFESYHHVEYWRKLMALSKSLVTCQTFAFMRTPPPMAVRGTVNLILDTMAAEDTPDSYLAELRALAARPDAALIPQARNVIIGRTRGESATAAVPTEFRDRATAESRTASAVRPFVPPAYTRDGARVAPVPAPSRLFDSGADAPPELPRIVPSPVAKTAAKPTAAPQSQPPVARESPPSPIARNAFGLPPKAAPGGIARTVPGFDAYEDDATFGLESTGANESGDDFGWSWEPPKKDDAR